MSALQQRMIPAESPTPVIYISFFSLHISIPSNSFYFTEMQWSRWSKAYFINMYTWNFARITTNLLCFHKRQKLNIATTRGDKRSSDKYIACAPHALPAPGRWCNCELCNVSRRLAGAVELLDPVHTACPINCIPLILTNSSMWTSDYLDGRRMTVSLTIPSNLRKVPIPSWYIDYDGLLRWPNQWNGEAQ